MAQQTTKPEYFPYLDFFRGIAVLWVVLHHINHFFQLDKAGVPLYFVFRRILKSGYLGVDMFFVISGFLITGILIQDLDRHGGVTRFYQRRFFKIYPQYLTVLAAGVLIAAATHVWPVLRPEYSYLPLGNLPAYFVLVQNYTSDINRVLFHTWSLAIEEHFYLAYAAVLFVIWKMIPGFFERRRIILAAVAVCMIFGMLFRWMMAAPLESFPAELLQMETQTTLYRFDALMFGCGLRILSIFFPAASLSKKRITARWLLFAAIAVYIVLMTSNTEWYSWSLAYIAPGLLMVSAAMGIDGWTKVGWIRFIGKNSYGIYLWHYVFFFVFLNIFDTKYLWLSLALYSICALGMGIFSTQTVEKYFLKIRERVSP